MKKLFSLLLYIIPFQVIFAQEGKITYKVVTFMTNQSFYLNGGTRAAFGGKSRYYFTIALPENTVEWYYAITTTPNENQNKSIGLASQLMKFIDPTAGIASTAASALMAPTGADVCDVYLVPDKASADNFTNKVGDFNYFRSDSRENYRGGVIQVRDVTKGTYFLSFKNPSATTGIGINVEVAAIVAEKSSSRQKGELYGSMGWKAYQSGDYERCLDLSKKAIELDSSLSWVQCNIALVYLITNKPEAIDSYVRAIDLIKRGAHAKEYISAAIKDIDDAKQKLGPIKDADLIRSLLMDEYKKY